MKSVGEVMAIGRNQQESMQKALRGLEVGVNGFDPIVDVTAMILVLKRKLCTNFKKQVQSVFGMLLMHSVYGMSVEDILLNQD